MSPETTTLPPKPMPDTLRFSLLSAILVLLLALSSSLLRSQIILRSDDGPRAGDSLIVWFITDTAMVAAAPAVGDPIPGQTWNFNLPGWSRGFGYMRAEIIPAAGTIFDTAYPAASLAVIETEENQQSGFLSVALSYLRPTPERYEDLGTASYYRASSSATREYLLISKKTGFGIPLPLAFGNERIEQSTVLNLATPYDTIHPPAPRRSTVGVTTLSISVDGWGTIITPFGSFQALRVHSLETSLDSLFNEAGEPTDQAVDTIETYNWYTRELGAALPAVSIEVYEGEIVSAFVARRIGEPIGGVKEGKGSGPLRVFPNPARREAAIMFTPRSGPLLLRLCAITGHELRRSIIPLADALQGTTRIDLAQLPAGAYLARIDGVGSVSIHCAP